MRAHWFVRLALLPLALAGCTELTGSDPETAQEADLTFVRLGAGAPEIEDTVVTFYAVRGQDRAVQIRYYYTETHAYEKCLRFVVPAGALRSRADGSTIAPGDSVLITVRMPDPTRFVFEFDPAGITFSPEHPATLEVVYLYADPDYNGDGVVNSGDDSIASRFGFWRQEAPGEPWYRVSTTRLGSEALATITGFTKYALASE